MSRSVCLFAALGMCMCVLAPEMLFAADGASLLPAASPLPAPRGVLKLLLLLTFYLHILLVCILVGSCIMAAARACTGSGADEGALRSDCAFLPTVVALAVNFGIPPYLFSQVLYSSFLYPSVILMAVFWVAAPMFVMLAYYGLYIAADQTPGGAPLRLVLLLGTAALLITALLFVVMNTQMLSPGEWRVWYTNPSGTVLNLGLGQLFPRAAHMLLACTAVGGLALALRAGWKGDRGLLTPDASRAAVERGLGWFTRSLALQAAVGLWFLFSLPAQVRDIFLGRSAAATAALVLALCGLGLAFVAARAGRVRAAAGATAGLMFLMVAMRDMARDETLAPYAAEIALRPETLPLAAGQDAGFAVFLACCLLAAGAAVYLWRVAGATLFARREGDE